MSDLANTEIYWQVDANGNLTGYHVEANTDGTLPQDASSGTYFVMTNAEKTTNGYELSGYTTEYNAAMEGQVFGAARPKDNTYSIGLALAITAVAGIAWISWFMKMEQHRKKVETKNR